MPRARGAISADTDNELASEPANIEAGSFQHIAVKAQLERASLSTLHHAAELVRAGAGGTADGARSLPPPRARPSH